MNNDKIPMGKAIAIIAAVVIIGAVFIGGVIFIVITAINTQNPAPPAQTSAVMPTTVVTPSKTPEERSTQTQETPPAYTYTPHDKSTILIGTWELTESNIWGVSETVEFRHDNTGTMKLGAIREDFDWRIDGYELIIIQGGGLLTLAYTITELNDTTLSYEADIPGIGFVRVTFSRPIVTIPAPGSTPAPMQTPPPVSDVRNSLIGSWQRVSTGNLFIPPGGAFAARLFYNADGSGRRETYIQGQVIHSEFDWRIDYPNILRKVNRPIPGFDVTEAQYITVTFDNSYVQFIYDKSLAENANYPVWATFRRMAETPPPTQTPAPTPTLSPHLPTLAEVLSRIEGSWVDRNYFYSGSIQDWNRWALVISFSSYGVHYDVGIGRWALTMNYLVDGRVELVQRSDYTGDVIMRFIVDVQAADIQEIIHYGGLDRQVLVPYREPTVLFAAERTDYGVLVAVIPSTTDDYFYIYRSAVEGERGVRIHDNNWREMGLRIDFIDGVGLVDTSASATGTYYYSAWDTLDGNFFPTVTGWQVRVAGIN